MGPWKAVRCGHDDDDKDGVSGHGANGDDGGGDGVDDGVDGDGDNDSDDSGGDGGGGGDEEHDVQHLQSMDFGPVTLSSS